MDYPDHGLFERKASTIGAGGQEVDGETSTIYNGEVDAQPNDRRADKSQGIETSKGSALVFFPCSLDEAGVKVEDRATITLDGGTAYTGRVDRLDHNDDTVLVVYD